MNKLALLAGSLLLAILGVTGCGGGGTDEGSQPVPGGGLGAGAPPPVVAAPIKYGDVIVLKSAYWRQHLSAQSGNSVQQALYPLAWEEWKIAAPGNPNSTAAVKFNDQVMLQSVAKTNWLSAQNNNAITQASAALGWEVWQFKDPANSTATGTVTQAAGVLLHNLNWNTYLSGRQGSGAGQTPAAGVWEQWLVYPKGYTRDVAADNAIHYGDVITARGSFRSYLSAQGTVPLGLADDAGPWEKWEVVNPQDLGSGAAVQFNGPVGLYAVDRGRFLSAQNDSNTEQVAESHEWEQWKIVDPANLASTERIKAIDTVALQSSRNSYLSAQQTVAKHVGNLGAWEQWVVAREDYYRNWMAAESAIHDKKLREITFPASHDAGTWDFLDEISNDPAADELKSKLAEFQSSNLSFGPLGIIDLNSRKPNILKIARDSIRPLAQATDRNVKQQLDAGVRWLDLRIDLRGGDAYTYHFLTGVRMEGVLDSIAEFLATTRGEILVLEMSHITPSTVKDASSVANYAKFATMVKDKLKNSIYANNMATNATPLMDRTYKEVVTGEAPLALAGPRSKVIVLMETLDPSTDVSQYGFWADWQVEFSGSYANKSNVDEMLTDQRSKFAMRGSRPFKLYMTLTGQPDELQNRVSYPIYNYLAGEWDVAAAVLIEQLFGKNDLQEYFSSHGLSYKATSGWQSLLQLSENINKDLQTTLGTFQSANAGHNDISVIYADYVNRTYLVDMAVRYSRLPPAPAAQPCTTWFWFWCTG